MSRLQLLAALLLGGAAACSHPASQPRVVGPVIGESTATGPSDPTRPPPRSPGVTEVSAPLHGTPTPVANPAPTVDTMPSTLEPSGNNSNANPTPVVSGVTSGPAPVGTAPNAGTGTAGPNGPGTGNTRTPTGPATGGAPTTTAPVTSAPGASTAPGTGSTPPGNGPGTGNTVNAQPLPANPPAQAPVTPRS